MAGSLPCIFMNPEVGQRICGRAFCDSRSRCWALDGALAAVSAPSCSFDKSLCFFGRSLRSVRARACAREAPGGRFWTSVAALVALLAGPFGARCLETAPRGWSIQLHLLRENRAAEHFDKGLLPAVTEVAGRRSRCSLSAISCMHGIGVLPPKSVSNTSGRA